MNPTQALLTADELFALPDDGFRHELIRGELQSMTPAGSEHGVITMRLAGRIFSHVESRQLGEVFTAETGFKLSSNPDTVRAPDLAFVRRERIPEGGIPRGFWPGAPDLAAEVVSPGDTYEEVEEKVADWLRAGAELVWIINPRRRTVTIHGRNEAIRILTETDQLTGGAVIPGFTCAIAELFP
jgi:Uma2 family endonuclease